MSDLPETATPPKPYSHRKRSGTETRERGRQVAVRLTAGEYAEIAEGADRAGLSIASFIRGRSVVAPKKRATRRPPIDVEKLASLFGQLGKIGSNINQIARAVNRGKDEEWIPDALRQSLAELDEIRCVILQAMGRGEP